MIKPQVKQIATGVEAAFIPCEKFKKSVFSISFYMPLTKEFSTANSLVSGILIRGTKQFDNYTKLNARLNELYGASISSDTARIGDMQQIVFKASCINSSFANGEDILLQTASLLCEMIFEPQLENGLFLTDVFESEKRLLVEAIKADMNDKRQYAVRQLSKMMYEGENSALSSKGEEETAEKITNFDAYNAYQNMIKTSFVRINICSNECNNKIFDLLNGYFSKIDRSAEKLNMTQKHITNNDVKIKNEYMDVTQGKLCIGLSVDSGKTLYDSAVLRVLTDIFGGGTYSNLFANVREKQSLCYYCSARHDFQKGTIIVSSGILCENKEKAQQSILNELESIKNGNITEELLATSKKSLCDLIKSSLTDSIFGIDFWYNSSVFKDDDSFTGYENAIMSVKLCDVLKLAKTVTLDSIYFLGAKEGE